MKNMIDDAIYSASPEIACRRYNPSLGIVLTAGSITLLWANSHASLFTENDMLSQWNLLISSCILCTGIVMICYRLFGDSSAQPRRKLRHQPRERLFERIRDLGYPSYLNRHNIRFSGKVNLFSQQLRRSPSPESAEPQFTQQS